MFKNLQEVGGEASPLKQAIFSQISRNLFYNQPFLKPGTQTSSTAFLKEISYDVDLKELYKVLSSCYINATMKFCPVLLEIRHPLLVKEYQCKYLLQVWNDQGIKVFQRGLQNLVKIWAVSNEFFVYKPEEGDQNSDCYHITNLKNDNSTILIKDYIKDPTCDKLAYHEGVLYIANRDVIHLIDANEKLGRGEVKQIELNDRKVKEITPGLPIMALVLYREDMKGQVIVDKNTAVNSRFNLILVSETTDNQLDFSMLLISSMSHDKFSFKFRQQKEVVPRDTVRLDHIKKLQFIVDEFNIFYGSTLRGSGQLDLYWDMTLVDSPKQVAFDISASFDTLYFSLANGTITSINTTSGSQINYEQVKTEEPEFEFERIFYQNIKIHFNIYNSFTLIKTTLYVAHGPFISLYNIQNNKWFRHMKFEEGEILRMVKTMSRKASGKEKLEIAVLLQKGSIYCDVQSLIFTMDESQMNISAKHRTSQVKGKILKTTNDNKHSLWFFIMTKDTDEKVTLNVLYYGHLYPIDYGLEEHIDDQVNFVPVSTSDPKVTYVLWQRGNHIILYNLKIGYLSASDMNDHNNSMFDSNQYQGSPRGGDTTTTRFQERHNNNQLLNEFATVQVQEDPDSAILSSVLNYQTPNNMGNIHSVMSMDINDHLVLVDDVNMYRYKIPQNDFVQYSRQYCVGMQVVDHKFCYSLSHCYRERSSGLRLYDINNVIMKNTETSYMLENVQVGINGIIDWNHDYSRLSFLKSFNSLSIVPALHRNTIAFIGIGKRETYLATKVIKDKFIALDCKNQLLCWSVVTGKLISVKKLPFIQDYTNYSVFECSKSRPDDSTEYAREWYPKILLTKNIPELDYDDNQFFSAEGIRSQIVNQETYLKGQQKEFREFKLIEIMSEVEVKEHFSFIHPQFISQHQGLYFSSNTNFMLEKLNHPRVFLFQKEVFPGTNKVKWNFVKRFNKYPQDLENETGFIRVMSPDFEQYIDISRGENQFVIRHATTDRVMFTISKDLMDPAKGDIHTIMNRFKWIDNSLIRLINNEGIEKIIDINDNFKEIEYNVIPLFDNTEMMSPENHYFTNRPGLQISEVLERLKRKYQMYKSAYYLEHKREPFLLYSEMFTVDYQIEKCRGMHVADLSFTYLHWKLMEQIDLGKVPLELIDDKQIEIMCYNILPGGNTIMHKLHKNGDTLLKIFKIAHPNEEDLSQMQFHIPFLPNLNHKSPMHLCLELQDLRTMDNMVKFLSAYGIDHHSRTITDILPFIIDKGLPSLLDYLDSRLTQTNQLRKLTKGCINQQSNGIKESQLWFDTKDFQENLLQVQEEQKSNEFNDEVETQVERPIKVEFVDLPRLYNFQDELCDDFFASLASTNQYQIFQKKAIQKLIEFNYPLVKEWTIKKLFIPFMTFQATLFFYLNFIFQINHPILSKLDFPVQIVLGMYAFYFLKNEVIQIKNDGFAYFTSVWNYIDVITPSTILSVLTINAFQIPIDKENERTIQAIGVFFMWFKFLYFFRIFKSYGYLTRLIILVISDMKDFLVVLFITIVAFSDSLLTISLGNQPEDRFVTDFTDSIIYTYRIVLGDFDVTQFGKVAIPLVYTLFIICTVFNTIVMLNLLIAIISETFAVVKENSENASYQEMASMIAENAYLIPDRIKESYADDNRYIMIVTDLDEQMNDEEDFMVQKIDQLKKNVLGKIENLNTNIADIRLQAIKQALSSQNQERQNEKIIAMLAQIPGISPSYSPAARRPPTMSRSELQDTSQNLIRQMFSIRSNPTAVIGGGGIVRQDTEVRFNQD